MKLYIANTTKQIQVIAYRMPEQEKLFQQKIPVGTQEPLYRDDCSTDQIEALVKQLEHYGARPIEEVRQMKSRYVGLIYSLDKPVPTELMEEAFWLNDEALILRNIEIRQHQAAAMDKKFQADLYDKTGTTGRLVDTEFREEVARDKDKSDATRQVVKINDRQNAAA